MPFGTITATESTFGSISGSIVGAVPGTLSGSVGVPGPQGPAGSPGAVGPQGPQGVPGVGGTWGSIVGTLSTQTDLQTALDGKYSTSNPSGFITVSALSPYLTTATANATFQTLAGMSSYLTTSALTGYATQSFVVANYAPIAAGLPTGGTVGQVLTKNSGTDYDDSWQTLIVGDRYLTTSTTSNSVSNGTKTFTVGTGLSYSSQQDVVISYDASNHMHALVTSYNSGTGVLVVDVQHHTGSGTYTAWTVNVGGTTPLQSVEWGEILGTLGDQSDLASALNGKLESTTAASTYAALAGATFTGEVVTPASTTSNAGLTIMPGVAPSTPTNGEIWATTNDLQIRLNGVTETLAEQSWVTAQGYLTSAPVTSVAGRTGAITLAVGDVSGAAALAGATFTGLVNTLASSTAGAGFRLPHGAAPTTPTDGDVWSTTGGLFWRQNAATKQAMNLGDTQTVSGNITFSNASSTYGNSTAAGTISIGTGATISGATKAINIGTNGVSGSTTTISIGTAVAGSTCTTTIANQLTATGTIITLGNSAAASTIGIGTGANGSGVTKAVNIGTSGVAGSTTNIAIGSTTGTSTTTLQGTTNGVTAAADTNSVALATTAFVVGQAGSATPLVDGTAAVGTSLRYARQDHVHPTDTSRAPLNSPAFTGTPSLPTGTTAVTQTAGNNTTAVATTAFVQQEVPAASTTAAGKVELATFDESILGASTTLAPTAFSAKAAIMSGEWMPVPRAGFTATNSGTGANTLLNWTNSRYTVPSSGSSGHAYARNFGLSQFDQLTNLWPDDSALQLNFAKRIWISGRSLINLPTQANWICRVSFGKIEASGVGDLALRGIGWKYTCGTSQVVQLMVHNGTTLTNVNSSFTPTAAAFSWDIISEGNGNVTLYINGASVATTSAGPSTRAVNNQCLYQEEAVLTATSSNDYTSFYCARGAIYVQR